MTDGYESWKRGEDDVVVLYLTGGERGTRVWVFKDRGFFLTDGLERVARDLSGLQNGVPIMVNFEEAYCEDLQEQWVRFGGQWGIACGMPPPNHRGEAGR